MLVYWLNNKAGKLRRGEKIEKNLGYQINNSGYPNAKETMPCKDEKAENPWPPYEYQKMERQKSLGHHMDKRYKSSKMKGKQYHAKMKNQKTLGHWMSMNVNTILKSVLPNKDGIPGTSYAIK